MKIRKTRLSPDLRAELKAAIRASVWSMRELADEVGYPGHSDLSRFLKDNQEAKLIYDDRLRKLVDLLNLEETRFLPQFELKLDERLIATMTKQAERHLLKLGRETSSLRGTSFHGFVGLRISGTVEKVFESVFAIDPQGVDDDPDAAAASTPDAA